MAKNEKKILFLIFLLILLLRIPTFYQPVFDIDETFFAQFAKSVACGNIPYVDAADNKSPLMLYFMAGIYWLTGSSSLIIIHIVNALILILTAFLLYKTGKLLKSSSFGLIAAFVFAILAHVYEPKNISANIETFFNLFFAAILYFYFRSWKNPKKIYQNAVITGLLTGLAALVTLQAFFIPVIIFVFEAADFFLSKEKPAHRLFFRKFMSLLTGAVCLFVPLAAFLIYFYKISALDGFFFWIIEHNTRYTEIGKLTISYFTTFLRIGLFILSSLPVWAAVFLFFKKLKPTFFLEVRKKNLSIDSKLYFFLFISLIAYLYLIILSKRSYGHYFLLLLIPLSLSAGMYFSDKISSINDKQKIRELLRPLKKWLIALTVLAILFTIPRICLNCMYQATGNSFGKADMEYKEIAHYLKENISQNTPILAWGFATPIYYYSGMTSATRFLSVDTLTGRLSVPDKMPAREVRKHIDEKINEKLWGWFWEDMNKRPPVYIIDTAPANYYGYGRFPIEDYPVLKKYLDNFYFLEKQIHDFKIYKRKLMDRQAGLTCPIR